MSSRREMTVAILFHAAVEATLTAGRQSLRPSHDIPSVVLRDSLEILSRSSRTVAPPGRAFGPGSKTRPTESSPHDNATELQLVTFRHGPLDLVLLIAMRPGPQEHVATSLSEQ